MRLMIRESEDVYDRNDSLYQTNWGNPATDSKFQAIANDMKKATADERELEMSTILKKVESDLDPSLIWDLFLMLDDETIAFAYEIAKDYDLFWCSALLSDFVNMT